MGRFKKPSNEIHILNGHYIFKYKNYKSATKFENLVKKLNDNFCFIDFDLACEKILLKEKFDKPYLAFSFDDGFFECYSIIAPVLDKYNVKAAFFINPFIINKNSYELIPC